MNRLMAVVVLTFFTVAGMTVATGYTGIWNLCFQGNKVACLVVRR